MCTDCDLELDQAAARIARALGYVVDIHTAGGVTEYAVSKTGRSDENQDIPVFPVRKQV